jgi:membrane fusion protein, multidrug efflux system
VTILKKRAIHFLITALLICIGTLGYAVLSSQKPQLKRKKPSTPVPMVRWKIVTASNVSVPITGEGTVVPFKEIRLRPQVSGKIIQVSPSFVNGGSYNKGDLLLQIDPTDYELAVTLAESRVKDSESKLKIAEQEAAAAKEEWLLLNKDQSLNDMPPLVAKEPQLKAAQAKLEADLAELQKALLKLERTEIKTPFKGRVSSKSVDVGQYVSTGQNLAVLFSTEIVEIVVPLENETLAWIHVPGFTSGEDVGSSADVIAFVAGKELTWKGRVVRSQGKLDPRTRMVPVVIQVNQPYATRPPLAAGLFAKVKIQGRTLENAMIIPRTSLRGDSTVWVINDEQVLTFRKVVVAKLFPDKAIITSGLQSGERIATSPLKMVTDGMKIQLESPEGE